MMDMKKAFNQIHKIMIKMGKERNEIREILNEIDSTLNHYDDGVEYLRMAREYYVEAMEKLEKFYES